MENREIWVRKIQCLCELGSSMDKNGLGVLIYITNFEPFGQQLCKGIAVSELRGDGRWGPVIVHIVKVRFAL